MFKYISTPLLLLLASAVSGDYVRRHNGEKYGQGHRQLRELKKDDEPCSLDKIEDDVTLWNLEPHDFWVQTIYDSCMEQNNQEPVCITSQEAMTQFSDADMQCTSNDVCTGENEACLVHFAEFRCGVHNDWPATLIMCDGET